MILRKIKLLLACLLLVACAAYAVRSVRAAVASVSYHSTKHGFFINSKWAREPVYNPFEVARRANRAKDLYPENHLFLSYAAGLFLDEARNAENEEYFQSDIAQALFFAKYALDLNPYGEEARRIYADALVEDGRTAEAIDFWREIVEREFWPGINQNMLASLLLRSGTPEHMREAVQMKPLVNDPELRRQINELQKIFN